MYISYIAVLKERVRIARPYSPIVFRENRVLPKNIYTRKIDSHIHLKILITGLSINDCVFTYQNRDTPVKVV